MPTIASPERPPERGKNSASGHAWLALLAQTQANRDAAAALLHAMRMHRDPSDEAPTPDELHCWYSDARETVATAYLSVKEVAAQPGASYVLCGTSMPVDTLLQGFIDGDMTAADSGASKPIGNLEEVAIDSGLSAFKVRDGHARWRVEDPSR